jgi:L-alanine-DL-glutamate epimerase-like enolase superfamily enzyme
MRPRPIEAPQERADIEQISARAYRIPTESPESDGTLEWDATTLVVARVRAGGKEGMGYSYAARSSADVIEDMLAGELEGGNAFDIPACWMRMCKAVRNMGRSGLAACAISAVDNALWDVKAKLLGLPLAELLGAAVESVPVYGSGGFTSQGASEIARQIERWRVSGITQFKIKIGRKRADDKKRLPAVARALLPGERLFVDANGAYYPHQAVAQALEMAEYGVTWFEEPVSSDDLEGLRFVREHAPAGMAVAAGEYGYGPDDFRRLLGAVDVLQADATRCLGISGFVEAAALAEAHHRPLSSHCAPALHAAVMCHVQAGVHMEYFFDHARIERLLFDGVPEVENGRISPQREQPGFGFALKEKDAQRYAL